MSQCYDTQTGATREVRIWDALAGCIIPNLPSTPGQYHYNLALTNAAVIAKGATTLPFPAPPAGLPSITIPSGWTLPISTPTGGKVFVKTTADVALTAAGNVTVEATGRDIPVGSFLEWPFLVEGITDAVFTPTTTLAGADGAGVGGFTPQAPAQSSATLDLTAAYNSLYAGLQTIDYCRETKSTYVPVVIYPVYASDYTREIVTGVVTPISGALPSPATAVITTTINHGFTRNPTRIRPKPL
jgi:hypothetical protein